ncbi:MAG: hypothetical protein CL596_05165 [Alteromonas sp.]|nr:hypothetical protein [Alteromonas sp.]|tara:strand:- start:15626 stop:15850 length:225 start_codon:yes stop_codon:yes gene_type:complete
MEKHLTSNEIKLIGLLVHSSQNHELIEELIEDSWDEMEMDIPKDFDYVEELEQLKRLFPDPEENVLEYLTIKNK